MATFMISVGHDVCTLQFANLETCDGISVGKTTIEVVHGGRRRLFDKEEPHIRAELIDIVLSSYPVHDANLLLVQGGLASLDDFTGELREYIAKRLTD